MWATRLAEFPNPDTARRVLEAIGSGDRTHANIAAATGGRGEALPSGTLSPPLRALELSDLPWADLGAVGGWWNRRFDPEVDLVGADRAPVANRIHFAGSIKWLNGPFDDRDLADLRRAANEVPGLDPAVAGLVVVSLSGADITGDVALSWGPDDVVGAWRQ